jgi:hypothetical protein
MPTWSILTGILALVVGIAVGMYHWQRGLSGGRLRIRTKKYGKRQ